MQHPFCNHLYPANPHNQVREYTCFFPGSATSPFSSEVEITIYQKDMSVTLKLRLFNALNSVLTAFFVLDLYDVSKSWLKTVPHPPALHNLNLWRIADQEKVALSPISLKLHYVPL